LVNESTSSSDMQLDGTVDPVDNEYDPADPVDNEEDDPASEVSTFFFNL